MLSTHAINAYYISLCSWLHIIEEGYMLEKSYWKEHSAAPEHELCWEGSSLGRNSKTEAFACMRHVTCGKPLTVFSFAVITQLPKNLIWCAGRMAQQVKKHMLLFQMSWLWFPAPMLGSPLQGDLMPSLCIWVHLDSHAHTHTETRTYIHIVLKNTS